MDRVVRKFNISSLITFEELKNFVVNENVAEPIDPVLCKDITALKLEYDDEEGDLILIASQREWQTAIEPWRHGTRNDSFRVKISLNRKNPKLAPIVAPLSPLEDIVQRSFHSPAAVQLRISLSPPPLSNAFLGSWEMRDSRQQNLSLRCFQEDRTKKLQN